VVLDVCSGEVCVFKRAVLLCTVDMGYHKTLTGRPHVSHTREGGGDWERTRRVMGWAGREQRG
jgi:hypothetical protein